MTNEAAELLKLKPFADLKEMLIEENRLETFPKNWPFKSNSSCNPEEMAAAGFYWIGNKRDIDAVRCFVCQKELDGWEEGDNPLSEHTKHSRSCPFVELGKTQDQMTVRDVLLLQKHSFTSLAGKLLEKSYSEFTVASEKYLKKLHNLL